MVNAHCGMHFQPADLSRVSAQRTVCLFHAACIGSTCYEHVGMIWFFNLCHVLKN